MPATTERVPYLRGYAVSQGPATSLFLSCWKEVIQSGTPNDARIPAKYTLAEYVTKELSEQARYELVILLPEVWPQ